MDEFAFIDSIKQTKYRHASVIKGIGDDAAVFRENYQDVVTAVDTFVENVHFSRKTMAPFHIGYRVLAANISDMAAMGATPKSYLISIVVPKDWTDEELQEIYQGMNQIAKEYRLDLIGGDTVSGNELVVSVTINGAVEKNKARYRSHVRAGDVLFVTGTLGDSAAGLAVLLREEFSEFTNKDYLLSRHRQPTPRVEFAKGLAEIDRVALNDISDGIASEANELAKASNITIHVEKDKLPKHEALEQFPQEDQLEFLLNGGEDFELVGTVSEENWEKAKEIAKKTKTSITKIGYATDVNTTNGHVFLYTNGEKELLKPSGYTHRN
ncbi:thiamine-monophosphate kinase [Natronobacillus azotifigens]|uniref:Thiamine-monophosphate kinase n=1 Tax=Natronobacillus azotifigens TaxID=472978 RepID=A0A9J6RGA8_9BACI|nr:thiamine-phosphate kinase [Natronobacillus azotifigens]MCZ0704193.1 thiamine-phosphate kinase [Natronobacillus azotifigens]